MQINGELPQQRIAKKNITTKITAILGDSLTLGGTHLDN